MRLLLVLALASSPARPRSPALSFEEAQSWASTTWSCASTSSRSSVKASRAQQRVSGRQARTSVIASTVPPSTSFTLTSSVGAPCRVQRSCVSALEAWSRAPQTKRSTQGTSHRETWDKTEPSGERVSGAACMGCMGACCICIIGALHLEVISSAFSSASKSVTARSISATSFLQVAQKKGRGVCVSTLTLTTR